MASSMKCRVMVGQMVACDHDAYVTTVRVDEQTRIAMCEKHATILDHRDRLVVGSARRIPT